MLTSIFNHNFDQKMEEEVNLSLTFTQRLAYEVHNCKIVYWDFGYCYINMLTDDTKILMKSFPFMEREIPVHD